VPADVRALDDPLPPAIAVDTSFLIVGLNAREDRHPRARRLLDRMEQEGTLVVFCPHLLLLELWSACSGFVRTSTRRELAALISAAEGARPVRVRRGRPRLTTGDVPGEREGRYRLAVETFERLVGEQLAVMTTVSVRLSMGLLAGARDALFTHSLRSYDAVMVALADEAAARAGTDRHLATFDADFLRVEGLQVWGLTR
jgi:predicted nucleic acid-binding protein